MSRFLLQLSSLTLVIAIWAVVILLTLVLIWLPSAP